MTEKKEFSFNFLDKIILVLISAFIISSFIFWFISNILRTNIFFIWILVVPVSIFISILALKSLVFNPVKLSKKSFLAYIMLFFFLVISTLFLLEPIISYPYTAIGIPYKDMHDGLASYIGVYGYPPEDHPTLDNAFIPSSGDNSEFLGWPNALHTSAGFLNKLGVFEFHSTWIVVILGLLASSLSIFLISKTLTGNFFYSATISGLFAISSFRIPYAAFTSIGTLYSYTLILPALLVCLLAIYQKKNAFVYIPSSISIALIAAACYGTIFIFIGLLLLLGLLLFWNKDKKEITNLIKLLLCVIPLLTLTFLFQNSIYWNITFNPLLYVDPGEPSQKLMPIDAPVYMIFYTISIIVTGRFILKDKFKEKRNLLKVYLFVINLGLLCLIPYDLLFHYINQIHASDQLATANRGGVFGTLNHMTVSRLALLQPFFFIFFLAEFSSLIKNNFIKILVAIIIIFLCFLIRMDLPLYQWIEPEIKASFYNSEDRNKSYTLISHMRLFVNERIWSKDTIDAFEYLKSRDLLSNNVLIWNGIDPFLSERTIAGWGSVYTKQKLLRRSDFNTLTEHLDEYLIKLYSEKEIAYILILYPKNDNLQALKKTISAGLVWKQNNIYIFKLKN